MPASQVETPEDLTTAKGAEATADIWTKELEFAQKYQRKWEQEAAKFFDIYNDEYNLASSTDADGNPESQRYNIFWANTQTLRPLVFSKLPKPNITQRFLDKDEISRIAAEMMERSINYFLQECKAEDIFNKCRDDFLIGGRGIARVVYDPADILEIKKDEKDEEGNEVREETLDYDSKKVRFEYVDWRNFRMSTENEWRDLRWIAFRHLKNREQLVEEYGEKGHLVDLNITSLPDDVSNTAKDVEKSLYSLAEVWEIWDKTKKKVIWLTTGSKGMILDEEEDLYNLNGFFPIPKPLGSESNPCNLLPIPLYRMYKSQAENLNIIDARIRSLTEQLTFNGIYASTAEQEDMEALFESNDGTLKAVVSTGPMQKVSDMVLLKPIDTIAGVIEKLELQKQRTIENIRDITGISDIVRGVTTASETATAQQLKGNFAISRIQPLQKENEAFVRDAIRLAVELKVEKYSISELAKMTNLKIVDIEAISKATKDKLDASLSEAAKLIDPKDPEKEQKLEQLKARAQEGYKKTMKQPKEDLKGYAATPEQLQELDALVKNDRLRAFSIDVETDSTIRVDQQQEKQDRAEYITAISNFSSAMFPLVQASIITKDAFNQFLLFVSKPYKVGRNVEESLLSEEEEPQPPSAEEMMLQAENQRKDQELQLKSQEVQMKAGQEQQKIDIEKSKVVLEMQKHEDDMKKHGETLEFEDVNKGADREAKTAEAIIKSKTDLLSAEIRKANTFQVE